jgi:branched-chain amino acid transport system permease protein
MDWGSIVTNTAVWLLHPTTIAYALAAVGLAIHFGFAGLLNFGMAGFMAVGAYGFAISVLTFGWPWWAGMLFSLGAGVVFAVILGIPTLRLRADYLAIATIAAAEIVRLLFTSTAFITVTGSNDGLSRYNRGFQAANPFPRGTYGFGPWRWSEYELWVRVFGFLLLAVAVALVWLLMRSPWGRVLKGIREDEDAVRSLGKNVFAYKMQALITGGVIGAAGGIVYVLPSAVVPGTFSTSTTFFLWTIILLGGAATVFGPVLGAVLFWMLSTFLDNILIEGAQSGVLPMTEFQAAQIRLILVGVALALLVIFRPQGILGDKREVTFVK